jgi:hypothetical protein
MVNGLQTYTLCQHGKKYPGIIYFFVIFLKFRTKPVCVVD